MKTPKFMGFDEKKEMDLFAKRFARHGGPPPYIIALEWKHQCDLVVMKKLWEIVELQRDALVWADDYTSDWLLSGHISETLAQVETMIEQLNKGVT